MPVLVYRVADLEAATTELRSRGFTDGHTLEIPQGPVRSFTGPGGHRLAIYQSTVRASKPRSRAGATSGAGTTPRLTVVATRATFIQPNG